MNYEIAVIGGDGIGPEVTAQAVKVLNRTGEIYNHSFRYRNLLMGGCAADVYGTPYPPEVLTVCRESDAVLLGAVGGPKWDKLPPELRPEKALLSIRSDLGLYANLRPAYLRPALVNACPLKSADKGFDIMIVRELTGGIYFGQRGRRRTEHNGEEAYDILAYNEMEIERIGRRAFDVAMQRRKKLASVDKANVLESSRLWRSVMHRLRDEYPQMEYSDILVDNCAMQLIRDPASFDVLVTENMFGDILSDEASMITGSIGLLPSASIGDGGPGLFEPIHGSAPDIAGRDMANPIASILSASMMLRYAFNLPREAEAVENAVDAVLSEGWRTADIGGVHAPVGTGKMGELICGRLK